MKFISEEAQILSAPKKLVKDFIQHYIVWSWATVYSCNKVEGKRERKRVGGGQEREKQSKESRSKQKRRNQKKEKKKEKWQRRNGHEFE